MRATCPSCGAPIEFRTRITALAVCGYCQSAIVRADGVLKDLGKVAILQDDPSILRVGAEGRYLEKRFEIVGRRVMRWSDGMWSEWYLKFADDTFYWLSEAQGEFSLLDAIPSTPDFRPKKIKVGEMYRIGDVRYHACDFKNWSIETIEGEVDFGSHVGHSGMTHDFLGPKGEWLSLEQDNALDSARHAFTGRLVDFEDLHLSGLRDIPGWNQKGVTVEDRTKPSPLVKPMNCPKCGSTVTLRCAAFSVTAVCSSCSSMLDRKDEKFALVAKVEAKLKAIPLLKIGMRGIVQGYDGEVIGFLRRRENTGYTWHEYLLYNPMHGFRWLVDDDGHWCLARKLAGYPEAIEGDAACRWKSQRYVRFAQGKVSVVAVIGEFPWRVRQGEETKVLDLIAPPMGISREESGDEVQWSEVRHVDIGEIEKAFGVKRVEPVSGVGMLQPNRYKPGFDNTLKLALVFFCIALLMEIFLGHHLNGSTAYSETYFADPGGKEWISESFSVTGPRDNVAIEFRSELDNAWIEMDGALVDEEHGMAYPFYKTLEYYHGYSDGHWSEGSRNGRVVLHDLPPAKYHLVLTALHDGPGSGMVALKVRRGVWNWSNFLWVLAALFLPVLIWGFLAYRWHSARWSRSDFTSSGFVAPLAED